MSSGFVTLAFLPTIAFATRDGSSVCEHLARSAAFVTIELETGERRLRPRFSEACGNHATFVQLLEGCDAVVCGGIGQGAADSLSAYGIRPLVIAERLTIEEALAGYRDGTLKLSAVRTCLCG